MKTPNIKLSIIGVAFLVMGVFADLLPHPALGPGLIESSLQLMLATQEPDTHNTTQTAASLRGQ